MCWDACARVCVCWYARAGRSVDGGGAGDDGPGGHLPPLLHGRRPRLAAVRQIPGGCGFEDGLGIRALARVLFAGFHRTAQHSDRTQNRRRTTGRLAAAAHHGRAWLTGVAFDFKFNFKK